MTTLQQSAEEAGLIADICREPEDDSLRLVLADWYEDRQWSDKADFIRWQVAHPQQIARLRASLLTGVRWAGDIGWLNQWIRQAILAASLPLAIFGEWHVTVSRGLISGVEMKATDFIGRAAALFAGAPVTKVLLTDKRPGSSTGHASGGYLWRGASAASTTTLGSCLHVQLFERLQGRLYDTEVMALADLSQAAVAYGREQASLPPLV